MAETWQDGLRGALLKLVQQSNPQAVSIVQWDEDIAWGDLGGCDTCGHGAADPYTLIIYYKDADGLIQKHWTTTPFGELLQSLMDD